ncbi:MAG: metallophosphoesterase family protein [Desulfobulbaceae bacterium]|nr:metallophosphoesterase family protein [Desulfobulbaceae bacterium]
MTSLAILSDSHDQIANLRAAINYCNTSNIDVLIHCGDLISPFMLKELALFRGPVHLIYGNNVGDQHLISSRCGSDYPNISHHGMLGKFTCDDRKIAMVHYPEQARRLASLSSYDIVCCGHSHRYGIEYLGSTLLINPGQLLGEDDQAGFVILDLNKWKIQRIHVRGCMFDHEISIHPKKAAQLSG